MKKINQPPLINADELVASHLNKSVEEVADQKNRWKKPIDIPEDALQNASNAELYDVEGNKATIQIAENKVSSYDNFIRQKKATAGKLNNPFNFRRIREFPLPSRGKIYKGVTDDPDIIEKGIIKMYNISSAEEDIIANRSFIKEGTLFRRILDNCIASDINALDLAIFDSNFLLFMLRSMSYDDVLQFTLSCKKCEREYDEEVRISNLSYNMLPEDFKEPIEIKLEPMDGVFYTVRCIIPRMSTSEEIRKHMKNKQKSLVKRNNNNAKPKEETGADEEVSLRTRLMYTTVQIVDGNNFEIPKDMWGDFFEALDGSCNGKLRKDTRFETGIDKIISICPYPDCGCEQEQIVPIDANFFLL